MSPIKGSKQLSSAPRPGPFPISACHWQAFFAGTTYDCGDLLLGAKLLGARKETGADTMLRYSIHKTGKQYVVRAKGKDLLICESRREAEHIVFDVANVAETSESRTGSLVSLFAVEEPPCSTADILAKAVLDIKLILDLEKALSDDLDFGKPRNPRQVQDQILTVLDKADAVGAAKRIQAGFRGLKVMK
ncbi:hypothetical protein [Nitrobacter sp. TKz-YC02]|uniref:hypothetical protein n=1 Tax=Nitrobacter sp. TKz-YC02 TaxID=3398704 RepID=UPI003CF3355C